MIENLIDLIALLLLMQGVHSLYNVGRQTQGLAEH